MSEPNLIPLAAVRAGTVDKIDRRRQYEDPEFQHPATLLTAVNAQGNHIRGLQSDTGRIQNQVFNLKLRNSIIVAIVTGVVARAPEIFAFVARLVR
jgi:hypothetical protein